jgi:hypothetical protein
MYALACSPQSCHPTGEVWTRSNADTYPIPHGSTELAPVTAHIVAVALRYFFHLKYV